MIDPTGRDIAASAAWLHTVFGEQVTPSHVEALAFVMASAREREREQIVGFLVEEGLTFAASNVSAGKHREAGERRVLSESGGSHG